MTSPAGWYPDPGGSGQQRYFDGENWTRNYAPYAAPLAPPPPPQMASGPAPSGGYTPNRTIYLRAFAVIAVLVLLGVGWAAITDERSARPSRSDAGMGQAVRDGEFEFVVESVYESGEATLPQPRGTWMVVAMTVGNTGKEPQSFFVQNQKLIDTAGREFKADTMASYRINDDSSMVLNLGPGFSIRARVPFDVPPGTVPARVELHDSAFSAGAVVTIDKAK